MAMIQQTVSNNTNGLCEELKQQLAAHWMFDVADIREDIPMFIFQGETDKFVPVDIGRELESKLKQSEAHYFKQGHMFPLDPEYGRNVYDRLADAIVQS